MIKEGMFYETADGFVECRICPNKCRIQENGIGACDVRICKEGKIMSINYGEISSIGLDLIEKKPLFHFKPGKYILSVGSFGCNFKCGFCQNYSISFGKPQTKYIEPKKLIALAEDMKIKGNVGIAFTYNEPTIWYEYVYDTSKFAKEKSIDVVLVTNGYINKEPLEYLLPYIDAMNIDLKAFNKNFYRDVCKGKMESVLKTIELSSNRCHIEITTLLINGYNDSKEEIKQLCKYISSINPNIPLHLTRYYPMYKFSQPATPIERILECMDIALEYLNYVYIGNVQGINDNTYCPDCGYKLIERIGYNINLSISENKCPRCGKEINIVI